MTTRGNNQSYKFAFVLLTSLFFFWGLANNMTDTLLAAFKHIMSLSDTQTSLIQMAFYGAYFCFALPAALFIKKFSYRSGIVLGLSLYACGAMMFYPAAVAESYFVYLAAIYILAGGCSILETVANPYILSMGSPETATRRLNLAQSFNPFGSITGILLSRFFILRGLQNYTAEDRATMSPDMLKVIQTDELDAITFTYMGVGEILLLVMIIMFFVNFPTGSDDGKFEIRTSFKRLFKNKRYVFGTIAQFFYVGAQICVWSFTIRMTMHITGKGEVDSSDVYLISIILFAVSRFLFTYLMRFIKAERLLVIAAASALICSIGVILFSGVLALAALVAISVFMSLMFPTICGCSLKDTGDDAKIAASGQVMAIVGGAVITPLQALLSDYAGITISFIVPTFCFAVVLAFALSLCKGEVQKS